MSTSNLKISKMNNVEKGIIINEVSIENKIIISFNKCIKRINNITKKILAVLEELGNGAGYALRR